MRPRLPLAAVALLGFGVMACGQVGKGVAPASRASSDAVAAGGVTGTAGSGAKLPQPELKADAELDSDSYPGEPDNDNNHVFGHAASVADARAATTLVKRYYAAAAAGDGATACSLMYSTLAESVPEDYGQFSGATGATSSRDVSCAVVMSSLFKHRYKRLSSQVATLKVAAVRVRRNHASVQFGFGEMRPRYYLELHRERGVWKIDRLIGTEQAIYVE